MIESAKVAASLASCVTNTTGTWKVRRKSFRKVRISILMGVSKVENGSSNNSTSGLLIGALANATHCFCPPDISEGRFLSRSFR